MGRLDGRGAHGRAARPPADSVRIAQLVLVGYSNGGALRHQYTLDALEDSTLPAPAKVILISPMIGVSPAAVLASSISLLGPFVPKARWIDVVPEYNPFKSTRSPPMRRADLAGDTGARQPAGTCRGGSDRCRDCRQCSRFNRWSTRR